ncbi:the carbohydrate recognition domain of complex with Mcfd2 [Basidiobolus meristosporus CBS 931.73]|uniref:The carbohydrate recognition domain of complex with Mcfd2 n=1 Tax=Basidiobolus meristosporus CBS 931.73 TaxID=1314790 RepID=A0A1Y1Z5T0_9FUNG|nr:the carbohydrate recognition domain of complex with Mcfd2 [Basidiobolus meristosporus CBS 931.73]|eukprot:ORY05648.1 the carbohydrate recognition domain of complex with Mcfd2 [Basidiobolus meristosporus CBS 931.73]
MRYCALTPVLLGLLSYRLVQGEASEEEDLFTRHDYKLSFKKPYVVDDVIPNFRHYDNAIVSPSSIRLAPSVPGLKGSIWAENPNPYKQWEVEFSFTITGRGYTGGNGLAFWYTKESAQSGPIYGSRDQWDGLAIFFDTFDPKANRYTPFVSAFLNDGALKISQISEKNSKMFAGCHKDYRNSKGPVYAKLSYYDYTLTLSIDTVEKGQAYIKCFEASDIELPTGYYFGFSASTSELADDHDIISFETYEVNPPDRKKVRVPLHH